MNRKFLYMTAMNVKRSSYTLHRIKASQLFYPNGAPDSALAAVEDRSVPPPTMSFHSPRSEHRREIMEFMLFGSSRNKIVCTDERGRAVLYDDGLQAVRMLPSLKKAKWQSVPLAVGDNLLVMEAIPKNDQEKLHQSFEALMYGEWPKMFKGVDFFWHSIPPPPYVYAPGYGDDRSGVITACTVVNSSSILISTESLGTYCLDTVSGKWGKTGAWPLPFKGLAEYVPEYDLWFGVSAKGGGVLCASDLGAALAKQTPPPVFQEWEGFAAPEGTELGSHLLHLGAGRFCVAKLIMTTRPQETCCQMCCFHDTTAIVDKLVMFTGVEIHRCGRGLKVIKHKSFRYSMGPCSMAKILY
ncbi:uncharacterized protein [Triticum aestivum]|uniref:uncharacterized protein n=1 Tax=Triticum aestivum TaxID=4565 RepID=UPI001D015277|nr:uncharacterized protein LOC123067648 [Triticum aestivum]